MNEIADPTKLKQREVPYALLDKIDRMIKKKLKAITKEELKIFASNAKK